MEHKIQHWIPIVYLNNFVDYNVPLKHKPYIHIYKINEFYQFEYLTKKAPSSNFFARTNGYSLDDENEEKRVFIEKQLGVLEKIFSKVIKKIEEFNHYQLTFDDKMIISEFIAIFSIRIPKREKAIIDYLEQVKNIMNDFNNVKSAIAGTNNNANIDYQALSSKEYINSLRFSIVSKIAEIIYYMKWEILEAPMDKFFITNDDPVCLNDDKYPNSSLGFASSKSVEVIFPLTSKFCLYCTHNRNNLKILRKVVKSSLVDRINNIILHSCDEYIFTNQYHLDIKDK